MRISSRHSFERFTLLVSFFAAALVSGRVAAQEVAANTQQSTFLAGEEVIVTGTREQTTTFESLSPVQVVNSNALEKTGQPDLRSALSSVVPSYINSPSNGSSSSKPVRAATLRGLNANQVLVLVNGHRRHNTALLNNTSGPSLGSAPVDLALIPASSVQRIEVLSDGAAAQYGSDAIAGVINIILKNSATGGSVDTQLGAYNPSVAQNGGIGESGLTGVVGFNVGTPLGAGFLNISGEFRHVGVSNVDGPQQPPTRAAWQIYAAAGDPREATADRYRQVNEVVPPGDTYLLSYNLETPVNNSISFYSDGTFGQSALKSDGTYRSETNSATIVGVSPVGGYLPVLQTKQIDFQLNAGFRGDDLWGWTWNLAASFGRNKATMHVQNGINASFGGIIPQQNFYNGRLQADETIIALDVRRDIDTGWFEDPLQFAAGLETRHNLFQEGQGEFSSWANGGYIFPANYPAVNLRNTAAGIGSPFMTGIAPEFASSNSRTNQALYLDFAQNITSKLKADLAVRLEHYSDAGDTISGKLALRYEIIPELAIRATVNNGFRAPSLAEQFTTVANQGPFASPLVPGTYIQLNSFNSISYSFPAAAALGAKPLKPERSNNVSVGIVAKPIPNLTASLDVYQINILDRIYLTGAFNGTISTPVRNVLQSAGLNGLQSIQYFTNIGSTRTQGLDVKLDYASDFGDYGTVDWDLSYALNSQEVTRLNAPPPVLANAGLSLIQRPSLVNIRSGLPQQVGRLSAGWSLNQFHVYLLESFYSKTTNINTANPTNPAFDSVSRPAFITDASVSYDVRDDLAFSLGVNNLFNKRADNVPDIAVPFITSGFTLPAPVTVSPYGNGGSFYYARLSFDF